MSGPTILGMRRALTTGDNRHVSPSEVLRAAADDFDEGRETPDGAMVLHVRRGDGDEFTAGWYASNLRSSDMIALMECIKANLLSEMGFGN